MKNQPDKSEPDSRSAQAKAYQWASQAMTVSLEMVVPGLVGNWADRRLGTGALLTILGFAVGMTLGMWHLIRMTRAMGPKKNGSHDADQPDGP